MSQHSHASYITALAAASTAIATLIPVALYQCGRIEHLPDPPGTLFASERITQSKDAYPLGLSDGLLGLASYGTTLSLLLLARRSTTAKRLLRIKLVADGGMASINVIRQLRSFQKICSWCTGTAIATAVMVPAAWSATSHN